MIWERMTRNRKYGIVTIISLTVCREDDSKDNHKDLTLLLINGNKLNEITVLANLCALKHSLMEQAKIQEFLNV